MRSVNQQLLAERLNLSRTTVSRSLANHPAISAETRAKVKSMAAELGYRGNPTRTIRRSRQSKPITIGVLIGVPAADVALATFPFVLQGIRERAAAEHVAIDVCYQAPAALNPDDQRLPVFRHIRSGDWRGMVLIYPFAEAAVDLFARKISTVAVLESYEHPYVDTIDTDDYTGVRTMVHRLAAAGHRRIGFVAWRYPVGGNWSTRRFGGYIDGLFSLGLEFNPDWAFNVRQGQPAAGPVEIADGVVRHLREHRVTAWVCAADHQAYQLMQDLSARGVRVPEHCSITGFDGLEPPMQMPRVASMRVPHEDIGDSAVARLLGRIMQPDAPRRKILVEAQFVEGKSIAPPAAV
jgi:LacI family transcriptional regulator